MGKINQDLLRGFLVLNEGKGLERLKREAYDAALAETNGNITKAAKLLGVGRVMLSQYVNKSGFFSKPL